MVERLTDSTRLVIDPHPAEQLLATIVPLRWGILVLTPVVRPAATKISSREPLPVRIRSYCPHVSALRILFSLTVLSAALAPGVSAQLSAAGTVTGTVRDAAGGAVSGALVSLITTDGSVAATSTSGVTGAFTLSRVTPGSYELRVEALGYRPLIARTLELASGEERALEFVLTIDPPPVSAVDTVAIAAGAGRSQRAAGRDFGRFAIESLPSRSGGVGSMLSLSTSFDQALGQMGLPGESTRLFVDGVPFFPSGHPLYRSEQTSSGLFSNLFVTSARATLGESGAAWQGGSGGSVLMSTQAGQGTGSMVEVAYSGDPLWSSSEATFEKPALLSIDAAARTVQALSPDATVTVVADVLRDQTPFSPRIDERFDAGLSGLDADLVGALSEPRVETYERYTGLVRFDRRGDRTSPTVFLRGAGGLSRRALDGTDGLSGRVASPDEETVEFSIAGGLSIEQSTSTSFEILAGVSGSYRDFGEVDGRSPTAVSLLENTVLGAPSLFAGNSGRTDATLSPVITYRTGDATIEAGAAIRASSHSSHVTHHETLFSSASTVAARSGLVRSEDLTEASFSSREIGLFTRYSSRNGSGLAYTVGGRVDFERFGTDEMALAEEWGALSGLANTETDLGFVQFGAHGGLSWVPTIGGGLTVRLGAAVREGDLDPRYVHEVVANDADGTVTQYVGSGVEWPGVGIPSGATTLSSVSMFGPDIRAPRTTTASIGFVQEVGQGAALFVEGAARRTDFLIRRRDLNIAAAPGASDAYGEGVFGTLAQEGAIITTTGDDGRRFASFGSAWALDPDGWSKYVGVTAGFEYATNQAQWYTSYTFSETTDNWVGAARGVRHQGLAPLFTSVDGADWEEGKSDFDVPHRLAAGATFNFSGAELAARYHFRSGYPFTPRYRPGVDANGDGSYSNDIPYVTDASALSAVAAGSCESATDGFAGRNMCRGPAVQSLDIGLTISLGAALRGAEVSIEGFNVVESSVGVVDDALVLVDPDGAITTSPDGSTVTIPLQPNPNFGAIHYPTSRGRMIRIGVRVRG